MSMWSKDLLALWAERWAAKHPSGAERLRNVRDRLSRVFHPVYVEVVAAIGGLAFGLFWGIMFAILWAPAGAFVGLLAFISGWKGVRQAMQEQ